MTVCFMQIRLLVYDSDLVEFKAASADKLHITK